MNDDIAQRLKNEIDLLLREEAYTCGLIHPYSLPTNADENLHLNYSVKISTNKL